MSNQKSSTVSVNYTESFRFTLIDVVEFLAESITNPKAFADKQLDEFEGRIEVFPCGCRVSPELEKLGCVRYRECITNDGYRVLYTYDEEANLVTAHAFLSKRQDIQNLLFKRIIAI
ncbi:addiction module toxin RelE [Pseudescherichia sp.]|uniref:addiction module toxin RelE n=1 Tax=Pseudescherichia sp. TaxID=2055881 RepID=UPI0028A09135|nr:addiction module toxin RelE [Pseudescherichia sp.]